MNCHLFIPGTQDEKAAGKTHTHTNFAAELHKEVTKGHDTQRRIISVCSFHFSQRLTTPADAS